MHAQHGLLQDIRSCALDWKVHRHPLGALPYLAIAAVQFGHHAAAPEHRLDEPSRSDCSIVASMNCGRAGAPQIGVDELLCHSRRDADVPRQRESRFSVEQGVVDDLGPARNPWASRPLFGPKTLSAVRS